MTYQGTHFNEKAIIGMTKRQFLMHGGRGNKLTEAQLEEAFDLMQKQNENTGKPPKSTPKR